MRRIGRPRANFLKERMRLYDSSTSGTEEHKNCITIDDSFISAVERFFQHYSVKKSHFEMVNKIMHVVLRLHDVVW
ncbi:hypothetical protein H5410_034254 [Solanum commersonii]|uniref:Uncharacterized protein n=1 Tax=Solanum commersonii TaxID=4109 RepID=A0A9J5YV12_SOLCO|nr:hypothetical protein H5410_034254 [Solanum commersonii]